MLRCSRIDKKPWCLKRLPALYIDILACGGRGRPHRLFRQQERIPSLDTSSSTSSTSSRTPRSSAVTVISTSGPVSATWQPIDWQAGAP